MINFAVYFNGNGFQNIWFKDILQGKRKKQTNINNQKNKLPCSGGGKPTGANSIILPSATPWKKKKKKEASKQNPQINQSEIAS